jgi:hypothetical protein
MTDPKSTTVKDGDKTAATGVGAVVGGAAGGIAGGLLPALLWVA